MSFGTVPPQAQLAPAASLGDTPGAPHTLPPRGKSESQDSSVALLPSAFTCRQGVCVLLEERNLWARGTESPLALHTGDAHTHPCPPGGWWLQALVSLLNVDTGSVTGVWSCGEVRYRRGVSTALISWVLTWC